MVGKSATTSDRWEKFALGLAQCKAKSNRAQILMDGSKRTAGLTSDIYFCILYRRCNFLLWPAFHNRNRPTLFVCPNPNEDGTPHPTPDDAVNEEFRPSVPNTTKDVN